MLYRTIATVVFLLILAGAWAARDGAAAADRIRLGLLDCTPAEPSGLIVGAGTTIDCRWLAPGAAPQAYAGLVETRSGDPSVTPGAALVWEIEAMSAAAGLDGGYALPPTAGNRLSGGQDGSITLIPASIMSQSGVNLAGSVTRLKLKAK